jgi:hypothetical protein
VDRQRRYFFNGMTVDRSGTEVYLAVNDSPVLHVQIVPSGASAAGPFLDYVSGFFGQFFRA